MTRAERTAHERGVRWAEQVHALPPTRPRENWPATWPFTVEDARALVGDLGGDVERLAEVACEAAAERWKELREERG